MCRKKTAKRCRVVFCLTLALLIVAPVTTYGDETDLYEALSQPITSGGFWRMVADDSVYHFPAAIKPEIIDRILFFPESVLLSPLDCGRNYDVSSRTYSVYRDEHILSFNIDSGQAVTSDGRSFFARVFSLNNQFYLPVELILREYGGTVEILSNGTPRLTTGNQRLSSFETEVLMRTMPSFQPDAIDRPPVHFLIRGSGAAASTIARTLETYGQLGAFFFTASDITTQPQRIIDLYVAGHTIGIYAESDALSDVSRANTLLYQLLKIRTPLVLTSEASAARTLTNAGYIVWTQNLSTADMTDAQGSLINVLGAARWRIALYIDGAQGSAERVAAILLGLPSRDQRLTLVTETTRPYSG